MGEKYIYIYSQIYGEGKCCAYTNKSIVKEWKQEKFYKVFPLCPLSFLTKISKTNNNKQNTHTHREMGEIKIRIQFFFRIKKLS